MKCCHLIRTLVSDDDVRVEFGRAHDYACMIAEQESGLDHLTTLLTGFGHALYIDYCTIVSVPLAACVKCF